MELNNGQKIGLVGGIIALVGFFLPWVSLSSETVSGSYMGIQTGAFGLIALISAILVIVFSVINKSSMPILTIVFAIIGLLLVLLLFGQLEQLRQLFETLNGLTDPSAEVTMNYGIGIWITIVGFIIGLVGGIMSMKEMKTSNVPPVMPPEEPQQF